MSEPVRGLLEQLTKVFGVTQSDIISQALASLYRERRANFNGWSNYATSVALIRLESNDTHTAAISAAINTFETQSSSEPLQKRLADWLATYVKHRDPLMHKDNMYSDLLKAALTSIDYLVIADYMLTKDEAT